MTTETAPISDPPAAQPTTSETAPSTPPVEGAPETSTPEPAPDSEPAPEPVAATPKSEAAKKGHSTRQKRAARRAELAEDADVQILLDQATKRGETKAKEAAAEAANRASMSELERAQAEANDFKAKLEAKDAELATQRGEREYGDALIESGLKVRAKSRKIFRQQVAEAMANDDTLSHADAITVTATEHDYLITPATQQGTAAQPGQTAPQQQRSGASTTPAPKRETAAPAAPDPKKPVDVMSMPTKEYREYRRQKYGISLPS